MAKFISKSANLHVILKPGIPAQPVTGSPAVPTISVRFQDGMVDIKDEELVELMKTHSGFNSDFILASMEGEDPYANIREESEPTHAITELKYGTPVDKKVSSKSKVNISPEMENAIKERASELAKQMLPGMVKQTLEDMVGQREAEKASQESTPTDTSKVETQEDVTTNVTGPSKQKEVKPKTKSKAKTTGNKK